MKPTKICLLLLAAGAAPLIRNIPSALAQPLPERRVLSGRVTDDAGNGLPRINITLQRENDLGAYAFWGTVAVTDAQGRFRIENAEDGSYLISAEADNFANVQNQHLRIDANSTVWNAQLQRLTRLKLKLKNAQGELVPNARPALRLNKISGGNNNQNSIAFARKNPRRVPTNAQGELEMPNIEPGTYQLDIALPGVGFTKIDAFAVPYEAQPVAREVQLERGGNVEFIAREAIAGEKNDEGRLLGGAILTLGEDVQPTDLERAQGVLVRQGAMDLGNLYAWSSDGSRAVTSDGDGALALQDLAPGRYTARLISPGYAPGEAQSFDIKSGQNQTLTFALKPRGSVAAAAFEVQDDKGAPLVNREWTLQLRLLAPSAPQAATPLPDATIIAPLEANLAIPLEMAPPPPTFMDDMAFQNELMSFPGVMTRRTRSNDKGQFTLYPLAPGRWMVTMFATPQDDNGPRGPIIQQTVVINANSSAPIVLKLK